LAAVTEQINTEFDTIVVGGGVVGLCATWFLAEEGAAVLCIDDGREAGSTANAGSLHVQMQSRMERMFPQYLADYLKTLSLYPQAVDFWIEIEKRLGQDIELSVGGGIMIAEDDKQRQRLERKCRLEQQHGVESELIEKADLLRMAPYLNKDVCGAVYCAKEGKVNPLLANAAIRRTALEHGGSIRSGARVESIDRLHDGFVVKSTAGHFRTRHVMIAAGVGSGALVDNLGIRLPTTAEPLHMNITEFATPFMGHLLQHAESALTMKQLHNGQVVIGGGWPAQAAIAPDAPGIVLDSLLGNLGLAQHVVPGIRDLNIIRSWGGINTMLDLVSVLGEVETISGLYVAVPGDAGYTLGPYCARLVVDQMTGRTPDYPLAPFSVMRFAGARS
jgi:glycine/D-amino acid oxidase-like deaminating enzyme